MSTFCTTTKFILKTDDDIFADIFQVVEVLLVPFANSQKTYACLNMAGNKPVRDPISSWYVSEELYSDEAYPEFCSGSAYLMKADDASKIYSVSNETKYFFIDDVFVTGILREKYSGFNTSTNPDSSLEIFSLTDHHRLKLDIFFEIKAWCNTGMQSNQLNYTFLLLEKKDIVRNMFCIWNKIRLMRFAMNNAIET